MLKIISFFVLLITPTILAQDVASEFLSFDLVTDVIPDPPVKELTITYPSGAKVFFGNELTPTDVKDVPSVTWDANPEDFFSLTFSDPDLPTRKNPEFREIKNWLVVNIPGNNLTAGETLTEYIGAGPYEGTGLHREVFILFKQPFGEIDFSSEPKASKFEQEGRRMFSTSTFAEKYSLEIYAGNFFQSQYDDFVPILIRQLHPELA